MEGVLLISTGFAPGSIYDSTLFVLGFFAVCASLDHNHGPFGTRLYKGLFETLVEI